MLRAVAAVAAPRLLAASAVVSTAPADTNENVLATITVPAGAMGANGFIRVTALWGTTSSAGVKTLRIRFGGAAGTAYYSGTQSNNIGSLAVSTIANRNSQSSQVGSAALNQPSGANGMGPVTSAVDTSAATTIVISGQKATAGDTLSLEMYLVELIYQA